MSEAASPWEQLMALRGMTSTTGVLHEAQVLNLKYWPRIALPHSRSSEFAYDYERKIIEFRVVLSTKQKAPKDLKKRLKGLDRSVKEMIGPQFTVRVVAGKKVLFKSSGKKPQKET